MTTEHRTLYVEDFGSAITNARALQIKVRCPFCDDIRSNKTDRSLSINTRTLAYHCHYCDAKGVLKSRFDDILDKTQRNMMKHKKEYKRPEPPKQENFDLDAGLIEYFKSRGISENTLRKCKVSKETHFFPQLNAKKGCIGFNYYLDGEIINVKYRTRNKDFTLVGGAELIPYNIDSISPASYKDGEKKYCLCVEGEVDCLTYVECGYTHVISVPNGANKNLEYLDDFIESHFDHLEEIYISSDNDKKGLELRSELLRRFGQDRCKVVDYPSPCKDINEVLVKYGRDAVKGCVENAIEMKPEGVQELWDVESSVDDIYEHGFQKGTTIGVEDFDKIFSVKTGLLGVITGLPSHGKCLSVNELLPTPSGWVKMGDLNVGDELYDKDGKICRVTYATPVMYNHECYRMTFSDGTSVICDKDHLWVTRDNKARISQLNYNKKIKKNGTDDLMTRGTDQSCKRTFPKARTTKEIIDTLYVENGKRCNHSVEVQGAIEGSSHNLSIHPYVLGYWLGNGSSYGGIITTADQYVIEEFNRIGYATTKHKYKYNYGVHQLTALLKTEGLIHNKMIPAKYLRASVEDRTELLKGLMDSDGTCEKDGSCNYSSSRKKLADDVYELVVSLGMKATITSKVAKLCGVEKKTNYRVNFSPKFNCFKLERKSSRIKTKYSDKVNWRQIVKIEPVESVPVKCITVDSPTHTYLCTKSMIPTHNTFFLNYLLIRLNIMHDWKTAFFSPEFYPVGDHVAQILETFGGKRFNNINYNQQVYEKMKEYLSKNMFWIDPNDTDINSVLERAKYLIKKKGIKVLVIDPFNALTDSQRKITRQDEYISDFLQNLRWFARKYDVAVMLVMHPTKQKRLENGLYPVCDLYDCKGASEIFDKADFGLTVWRNEAENYCEVHVTKMKFRHLGEKGHATFKFDTQNGRYDSIPDAEVLRAMNGGVVSVEPEWDRSNYIIDKVQHGIVQQSISYTDYEKSVKNNENFDTKTEQSMESYQHFPSYLDDCQLDEDDLPY